MKVLVLGFRDQGVCHVDFESVSSAQFVGYYFEGRSVQAIWGEGWDVFDLRAGPG